MPQTKIVEDVKRYLWLHPAPSTSVIDPVELLRDLLVEHEKLVERAKKKGVM